MRRLEFAMIAALVEIGAICMPASAQEAAASKDAAGAICTFHGDGCEAPPAEWTWQRLEPRIGVYSVELPCDERQVNAFGQIVAMSRANFPAGSTRACMKASSGFTATLIGLTALPDDTKTPETDRLLQGAPDLFTAFVQQTRDKTIPVTTFKGRRAAINTIEKDGQRTRVVLVEVGRFAQIMLLADFRAEFPGTRQEADAAAERFLNSLEIAE